MSVMGRVLPTAAVGYVIAQLGSQLPGREITKIAAEEPSLPR